MTGTNPVDEWLARNPRRSSPEVDYGQRWTSTGEPGVEWRIAWNTGTGEVYAARHDDADLHVLGIARTFAEAETALQGWASHAEQPGGLDWVIERTRDLTGDGELSLHLSRLRSDLSQLASHPEPLGRHGLSVEL
ncbi:MAG: hypothetical protein AAB131_16970 [Actinomycetota bacterium]